MNDYDSHKIIDELIDNAKIVKQMALSNGEEFLNIAFIIKEGKINPLPMTFIDDMQKRVMIDTLKDLCEEIKAEMIVIVNDAYYLQLSSTTTLPSTRPSEHPHRKECLAFVWESKIDNKIVKGQATIPYHIEEGELKYDKQIKRSQESEGLFTNILS